VSPFVPRLCPYYVSLLCLPPVSPSCVSLPSPAISLQNLPFVPRPAYPNLPAPTTLCNTYERCSIRQNELISMLVGWWAMKPLLSARNLVKDYGSFRAVHDVSFDVYPGDVLGFLGPNGAGKSTTLRMLLSLIRPTQGEIHIFGKDLLTHRTSILSKIGCIIEKPDFYKYLSARKNLQLFARWSAQDIPNSKIDELLEFVGLGDRGKDTVAGFSHGMRQRLGIAQALLNDPELILLDEPTTGLDPQGIIEVRELILRLKNERNKTIVLSSHLLSEIELIANRMVIINKGKALVEGEVSVLLNATELFVYFQVDEVQKALAILQSSAFADSITTQQPDGFQLQINREDIPVIIKLFTDNLISIYSVEGRRKLEDYFLKLTHT
jgi:ABC-type multidrug transport system ATPase subunit